MESRKTTFSQDLEVRASRPQRRAVTPRRPHSRIHLPRKDRSDVAPIISTIVQWVIVPLIMLAVFAFACVIACSARTPEVEGLVVGRFLCRPRDVRRLRRQPAQPDPRAGLSLFGTAGAAADAATAWASARDTLSWGSSDSPCPRASSGSSHFALAASSTSAVFTYIFIDNLRVSVLYWTLGSTLGILLHIVLFPTSVEHIFNPRPGRGRLQADARRDPLPELSPRRDRGVRTRRNQGRRGTMVYRRIPSRILGSPPYQSIERRR